MWWIVFEIVLDTCLYGLQCWIAIERIEHRTWRGPSSLKRSLAVTVDVQHHDYPISHVLPFDIIALIIDIEQKHKHDVSHKLTTISTYSCMKWAVTTTTRTVTISIICSMICSHPSESFQISSQQFLVSTSSQSPPHVGTGIHTGLFPDNCVSTFYALFLHSTSHVSQFPTV